MPQVQVLVDLEVRDPETLKDITAMLEMMLAYMGDNVLIRSRDHVEVSNFDSLGGN